MSRLHPFILGVLLSLLGLTARAAPPPAPGELLFARRVGPLLESRCAPCHGGDQDDIRGKLDLRTREALLRGGESGDAAIDVERPRSSPLWLALRGEDGWSPMPPKENDRLTEAERAAVLDWIAAGAPWPDAARREALVAAAEPEGTLVATRPGLQAPWSRRPYRDEDLWAYRPLSRVEPPAVAAHPVDAYLERAWPDGLTPAPQADRRTLIRRATYDLWGLPPTSEEVAAFVDDPAPDDLAWESLLDRLLASPHYGEQWGRHWLDVVRYADSAGLANDYERGPAWRYRDYVVRSLQDDKPYGELVREQLAGDEMLSLRDESRRATDGAPADEGHDSELLIATGFLRMGPWELTGMEVAKVARQRFLDDVTDTVGQVLLAHPLQCARCHDHKFDPLPTRDYYSLQAVFATTQLADRPAPFLREETTTGFEERAYLERRREHYQRLLTELDAKLTLDAAREWLRSSERDGAPFERAVRELTRGGEAPSLRQVRQRMERDKIHPDLIPPRHAGFEPRDFGLERVARKGLERLGWLADRYEPIAISVFDGPTPSLKSVVSPPRLPSPSEAAEPTGEAETTHILIGGDPFTPGEPVRPGFLSAVVSLADAPLPLDATESASGRRLALADWIVSRDNPLTWRVIANRVWQGHFGRGLAANPNNFGATGAKPTHPELLDWLARELLRRGGSLKSLHRLVMTSAAYRRDSRHPSPGRLAELDPSGASYAAFRPRRLDAEELHDAALRVSGELNPLVGGVPVRPLLNLDVALQPRQVMGTFAEAWQPSPRPAQRNRRALYAQRLRGLRDPLLEVLDAPAPELSCEARSISTTAPQALSLLNGEFLRTRALVLAARLASEGRAPEETLRRAFQVVLTRAPSDGELAAGMGHWRQMTELCQQEKPEPPVVPPAEAERVAVEENTGEEFRFTEPLEAAADFVPDLAASDVAAETRGLAEVCLVLLNTNEFAYVD